MAPLWLLLPPLPPPSGKNCRRLARDNLDHCRENHINIPELARGFYVKSQRCASPFLHSLVSSSETACYAVVRLCPILSLWTRPCSSSSSQRCLQGAVCDTTPVVQAVLALRCCGLLSVLTDSVLVMRLGSFYAFGRTPSELMLFDIYFFVEQTTSQRNALGTPLFSPTRPAVTGPALNSVRGAFRFYILIIPFCFCFA